MSGVRVHTRMVLRPHPRVPAVTLSTPAPHSRFRGPRPPQAAQHTHARTSPQSRCLMPSARASSVGTRPHPSASPTPTPRLRPTCLDQKRLYFSAEDALTARLWGWAWLCLPFPRRPGGPSPLPAPPGPGDILLAGTRSWWREREASSLREGGVSWKPCGRGRASGPSPEEGRPQAEQQRPGQGPGATPRPRPPVAQIRPAAVHIDL